jgi:translation initiation factor IF-2
VGASWNFSHGRSKVVQVERKRKRQFEMGADGKVQEVKSAPVSLKDKATAELFAKESAAVQQHGTLTNDEKAHRLKALQDAIKADEESRLRAEEDAKRQAEEDARLAEEEKKRAAEAPPVVETPAAPAPVARTPDAAPVNSRSAPLLKATTPSSAAVRSLRCAAPLRKNAAKRS